VLLWQAIATTAGGILAPTLARIDRRGLVLPAALMLQAAGLAWAATDPAAVGPALLLIGAGFGVIGTLGTTALFVAAPAHAVSQVGVVQEVAFALGSGLGIAALAALAAPSGYSGSLAAGAVGVTATAAAVARIGNPLAPASGT
jgi:DHA2 family multidrug resistance protein-like MFS transporter